MESFFRSDIGPPACGAAAQSPPAGPITAELVRATHSANQFSQRQIAPDVSATRAHNCRTLLTPARGAKLESLQQHVVPPL
jgi:hypothetical protein